MSKIVLPEDVKAELQEVYSNLNAWLGETDEDKQEKQDAEDIENLSKVISKALASTREQALKEGAEKERNRVGEDGWHPQYSEGWHDGYAKGKSLTPRKES